MKNMDGKLVHARYVWNPNPNPVASFPVPARGEIDVNIAYKIQRTVAELQT